MSSLDWIQVKSSENIMRTLELMPCGENRKSYYGRAFVHRMKDGRILLQSYNTIVAGILKTAAGREVFCCAPIDEDLLSVTTCRHIHSFYFFNNFPINISSDRPYKSNKDRYRASMKRTAQMMNTGDIPLTAFDV